MAGPNEQTDGVHLFAPFLHVSINQYSCLPSTPRSRPLTGTLSHPIFCLALALHLCICTFCVRTKNTLKIY